MLNNIIREYVLSKLGDQVAGDEEIRQWIYKKSQEANQRNFVTHAPKFIHPDAKVSAILVKEKKEDDGYIRTENVPAYLDSIGNAAAMPITELMNLDIDGKPFYEHLQENTEVSKEFVEFLGNNGEQIKDNYLKMFNSPDISSTDARVRQVFFPVEDENQYHIITPMMSSPVMNQLATILTANRMYISNPTNSDAKNPPRARDLEKKGEYLEGGYWTLSDTVNVSYGGSKPQNISSFNNKVKTIKLLKSLPPEIRKRRIRIPISSFFSESIYLGAERYSNLFLSLDKIYRLEKKNVDIRDKRDEYMGAILEEIATDIASVRYEISFKEGNYRGALDSAEYIMLYEDEMRYENDIWLEVISEKFARWFFSSYKKIVNNPFSFSDGEFRYVRDFAFSNKEDFIQ